MLLQDRQANIQDMEQEAMGLDEKIWGAGARARPVVIGGVLGTKHRDSGQRKRKEQQR